MPDGVMVFAAGFGTRMGSLTRDRPKPLIPVAGRALLDHALALTGGMRVRVVNAHYRAGQIAEHLAGSGVRVSEETPDILDTGGGLRHALPFFGDAPAVFTLNSDAVWAGPNPLPLLARAWDPARMDALLACVPLERAVGRQGGGDFTLAPDGRLTRGGKAVYTGAQIVATAPVAAWPGRVFSLGRIWDAAAERGRLFGIAWPGRWADVGHPGGIAAAEAMLADV